MTVIWLIVWLISHTPTVAIFSSWNAWGTALVACIAIDLVGSISASSWRRREVYFQGFGRTWRPNTGWTSDEPHGGGSTAT